MPRTFIAFEIDPSNQKQLVSLKDRLDWGKASIKWVQADQIHLTLKFLGDISQQQVESVKELLPELLKNYKSIDTVISHLGAFPHAKQPKVLWAGLTGDNATITSIVHQLEDRLATLGFSKEQKNFSSHITIGRVRSANRSDRFEETLGSFRFAPPLRQTLQTITFYESRLTTHGPIYTPIVNVVLPSSLH